jgi:pimeloyl-ACP methyl ester carboxylesterase
MECKLDGITVYYEIVGEGKPIVMLPPVTWDHRSMVADAERNFEQRTRWQRIYLDWPGTGTSSAPDWVTSSDDVLAVIESFIDAVIPGRRFAVVGDSYGGYIARGLVYRRGDQMDGVLLNAPGPGAGRQEGDLPVRVVLHEDAAIVAELRTLKEGAWIAEVSVAHTHELVDYARAIETMPAPDEALWARVFKASSFSFDVDSPPQPFAAPAVFILGRQDHLAGYRPAWRILENYPRATFAVLDRAGHLASLEQSALYCALVGEWLDRVQEWSRTRSSDEHKALAMQS